MIPHNYKKKKKIVRRYKEMESMAKKDVLRLLFRMLCTEYIYIYILFFGGMKRGGGGVGMGW